MSKQIVEKKRWADMSDAEKLDRTVIGKWTRKCPMTGELDGEEVFCACCGRSIVYIVEMASGRRFGRACAQRIGIWISSTDTKSYKFSARPA